MTKHKAERPPPQKKRRDFLLEMAMKSRENNQIKRIFEIRSNRVGKWWQSSRWDLIFFLFFFPFSLHEFDERFEKQIKSNSPNEKDNAEKKRNEFGKVHYYSRRLQSDGRKPKSSHQIVIFFFPPLFFSAFSMHPHSTSHKTLLHVLHLLQPSSASYTKIVYLGTKKKKKKKKRGNKNFVQN